MFKQYLPILMSLHIHILDISARDEKIVSENDQQKLVQYDSDEEGSFDEEFQSGRRGGGGKGGNLSDLASKRMLIHCFGKTADGKSVRCDIKGFKPFFFLRGVEGTPAVKEAARRALREYMERHLPTAAVKAIELTHCSRRELFGYTQGRSVPMFRIQVPSVRMFHEVKKLFLNAKSDPELKMMGNGRVRDTIGKPFPPGAPTVYEANLDPMLRFLHLRNLKPCGWATVDGVDPEEFSTEETTVVEIEWEDIAACAKPPAPTAPFKIASWDIECMSNTGNFPMATKGDPVIQIGTILGRLGSTETEKHIFVLGTCDNIPEGKVHIFKKEKDLILGWFQWMGEQDVDILMGYNIFGFDEKYVWERCVQLGINGNVEVQQLNRLHEEGGLMELEEKRLSSSALGDNIMYLWTTTGRLRVDLYHYIKRGYQLPSYKLDDTSRYFLGEAVRGICVKVDCWQLSIADKVKQDVAVGRSLVLLNAGGDTLCEKVSVLAYEGNLLTVEVPDDVEADEVAKWAIVKDDVSPKEMFKMHSTGGPADRATIARYCVQDCQLVVDLFRKLEVFNNSMSMANVCSVPISYIFLRGQGIKIESLMFKYCYENEQCIKVLPGGGGGDGETYEGAIVLDPTPGFYTTPVGVADFASLYPSTIISENISHDTLVWVKDYDEKGNLMTVQWGSDEYDNLPGVAYTDIEYDNLIDDPNDMRKMKRKIKAGVRVCRYAQDKIGTIPQIVAGLLAARKAKRKEAEKEADPFKVALLDAEQLAYKLTANSLYGQLGSGTFKVRLRPLAASVTAYGRKQIMFSKAAIEEFYGPKSGNPHSAAEIVYGDTDSLFIAFHPKDPATGKELEGRAAMEKTIHLTEEAGKFVSKMLKAPHDFEFDKVYWPFIIFSKKRYVGHKYEDPSKHCLWFMGVALKRRDYAAIAKRFYSGALNILLNERNVVKAAELVKQMAVDLVEGKFGLQPLIISKSLRAEYATAPAHKMLADRMAARDPGNAPASGDRIPYVYVQPEAGQGAPELQGERIETPSYIKEKDLKPDYMYYIDHQIANPVCQLFGVVVDQLPGFNEYRPRGGWKFDNPDTLTTQRETAAYHLLFKPALDANERIAKRAFLSQTMGAEVAAPAKPKRTYTRKPAAAPEPAKRQSTLDSMFAARIEVAVHKEVKQRAKKAAQQSPTEANAPSTAK